MLQNGRKCLQKPTHDFLFSKEIVLKLFSAEKNQCYQWRVGPLIGKHGVWLTALCPYKKATSQCGGYGH